MLPIPLILVIVACGIVVTGMIIESCYVTIQNVRNTRNTRNTRNRIKRKQPPLSICDENTSDRTDNTNEIL